MDFREEKDARAIFDISYFPIGISGSRLYDSCELVFDITFSYN